MDFVRLGIIGMGNVGRHHADYLLKHQVDRCKLVAVCSRRVDALEQYRPLRVFADGEKLIRSGEVDAVIIATPPFHHTSLGIAALHAGVHAMVEKPIAAHKADAQRLIDAHAMHPRLVLGGMFQLRVEPRYRQIQKLIADGHLGELARVNWINTDWFRTEAYYASGAWRGTWSGEGGGVLLNQCLHNLDTLQWLCGMPARVRGFCQFGRFHHIEVEDQATAYFEWANGATGTFVGSTGEAPGTNRLEITGSRGRLVLEADRLLFMRNETNMFDFSKAAKTGFTKPPATQTEIPFDNAEHPHAAMMQNFVNAILDGSPLIAPAEQGVNSVELANACVYSSLLAKTIEMPMDGAAWEAQLNRLIAGSTMEKRQAPMASTSDFAGSFRK